ncbi:MAG: DNA methyltransferase [Planctomycetota bacterium]|nr:DNA methyltransferase [Planctomycetota bacterium]
MIDTLVAAAHDRQPVSGWTHNFYRHPARFSPTFAAAAIKCFTKPGDLVLDPYMGGGTSVVEALALGRQAAGNDLNSLAVFITAVKTTALLEAEAVSLRGWADTVVPALSYWTPRARVAAILEDPRTKNLNLPRARFIKKVMAIALTSISGLPSANAQAFARCAILRTGQWALDGRRRHTRLSQFRMKLAVTVYDMLSAISAFGHVVQQVRGSLAGLSNLDAAAISSAPCFVGGKAKARLVVTSPPYPGVHVLYHRWQVDGRRETPAPYWVAGCNDGQGASFYNFGDRRETAADN